MPRVVDKEFKSNFVGRIFLKLEWWQENVVGLTP